jgi:hypothetical protein
MKEVHSGLEKQTVSLEKPLCCSQCGWPGTGKMPAGVSVMQQKGKSVLIGRLSYFRLSTVLCSVCQEMESAVASRPWFLKAHAEYLNQIKVKKQLSGLG